MRRFPDLPLRHRQRKGGESHARCPSDQRHMASVFSASDRFVNLFGERAPLRSTPFSNDGFRAAAQTRFGAKLTCLKSFTNLQLKSNASAPNEFVDAFGGNIKSAWGQGVEARRQPTARS